VGSELREGERTEGVRRLCREREQGAREHGQARRKEEEMK